MPARKVPKHLISLLKGSVDTYIAHPVILIPFVTIAFIQLLVLEILYFSPRFPLSIFFNPVVKSLWGGQYVHYPANFLVLPKLFQNVQVFIYIFIGSYFIAVAIGIIAVLNSNGKISLFSSCRDALRQYVHIFVGALISFIVFFGLHKLYNFLMLKALNISSIEGAYNIIKNVIFWGSPYVNLLIGTFVAAIFAFVFPIIIIDKKKIFAALWLNFKNLWGSFWFIFLVAMIPTLFYLPVLLIRNNINGLADALFPEVRIIVLMVSIIVTMFIDATIYTAMTLFYLLKKEQA